MTFVSLEEVLAIHDRMLEVGGGRSGMMDFTLLHSAIERPKVHFGGEALYTSVWMQGAALLQSLIKNHPFEDGNKRTAYFSTCYFLWKNGYELNAPDEAVLTFVVEVDVKKLKVEPIARWLESHAVRR